MKLIAGLVRRRGRGLTLSELAERAQQARTGFVKVGILGHELSAGGEVTVLQIGIWNEFGTKDGRVPSRPFLRSTFRHRQAVWREMLKRLLKQSFRDRSMTVERALGLVGVQAVADVRATITTGAGVPPPNAPSTIEKKGSDRPLVDTGGLVGAITHLVEVE